MLDTIRNDLQKGVNEPFGQFYQHYIMKLQDEIIQKDIIKASLNFSSIEDTVDLMKGLNKLEEELNTI